jgi:2-polyprenyl-3-methyl-5-hydroxy-6-metoxy-1,4-benzoquinol methylase
MSETPRTFGVSNADQYWQSREQRHATRDRRLHRFMADLIDRLAGPGGKVLEVGVGSGNLFRLARQKQRMYGVEMSAHAISGYDFPTDTIRQADVNHGLPDFGTRFMLVVASMVLHWMDDPELFLKRSAEVLEPGGKLLLVIPNICYYKHRIAYLFGRFPPISLSHRNFQTADEFESMTRAAGFQILRRTSPKRSWRSRWWPTVFSQDLIYVLQPGGPS